MQEKTARLRRLLAEGYAIEDIESDEGMVETTLRRGSSVIVLRFLPDEAADLLYEATPLRH